MFRSDTIRDLVRHPLFMTLYLPSMIFGISQSMLVPIIPFYGEQLGASFEVIGIIFAASSVGMMLGELPAGLFVSRLGRKNAMLLGVGIAGLMTVSLFWAQSVSMVILLRLIAGLGMALFALARHEYVATATLTGNRGRNIALLGGIHRVAKFIGPTLATTLAWIFGIRAPFILFGVACVLVMIIVFYHMPSGKPKQKRSKLRGGYSLSLVKDNSNTIAFGGLGQLLVQMTRAGSSILVPLYAAEALGLDVSLVGPIVSISAAIDMLLFYPAGWLMDNKGRKYAIVPSFTIQALALALIPLTTNFWGLAFIASMVGMGNGLSAGTMMTVGSDLAPENMRGEFLGIWRLIGDTGNSGGQILVGQVAGLFALSTSAFTLAFVGAGAAIVFAFMIPETLEKSPPPVMQKIADKI
jgi:MFS family permease